MSSEVKYRSRQIISSFTVSFQFNASFLNKSIIFSKSYRPQIWTVVYVSEIHFLYST